MKILYSYKKVLYFPNQKNSNTDSINSLLSAYNPSIKIRKTDESITIDTVFSINEDNFDVLFKNQLEKTVLKQILN